MAPKGFRLRKLVQSKITLSTVSRARWYFLASSMRPVFKIFFFLILVLESVRFKLELDVALHQPKPIAAMVSFLSLWLPIYVSIGLQFSLFVGLMVGIASVSKSRELDVMHALGLGLHNLMAPVLKAVVLISILTMLVLGWAQPLAIYATKVFTFALQVTTNILLDGGNITFKDGHRFVFIDSVSARGQNFERLLSFEDFGKGNSQTISGGPGELRFGGGFNNLDYTINDTTAFNLSTNDAAPDGLKIQSSTQATSLSGNLGRGAKPVFRPRGESEYEWTLSELFFSGFGALPFVPAYRTAAEIHFRVAQFFFTLILPLLAAIVAIEPKRNPSPLRQGLAAVFVLAFHQYLSIGANISRNNLASPLITLWLPLAILATLVVWRFWKLSFRPQFGTAR